MSPFYGFHDEAREHDDNYSDYKMTAEIKFDEADYSIYNSCYTFSLIPAMLLIGPFASTWNRKWTLSMCVLLWSLALAAHGLVRETW